MDPSTNNQQDGQVQDPSVESTGAVESTEAASVDTERREGIWDLWERAKAGDREKQTEAGAKPAASVKQPQQTQVKPSQPAEIKPVPAPPQQSSSDILLAQALGRLQQYEERERQRELQARQQQQQPQAPDRDEEQLFNTYALQLTPELLAGIQSEDPVVAGNAWRTVFGAFGTRMHQNMVQIMQGAYQHLQQQITQQVPAYYQQASFAAREQEGVVRDFYTTFPQFNRPEVIPVVQQATRLVAQERPDLLQGGWNDNLKNAIAARANGMLQSYAAAIQPNGNRQPQQPTGQFFPSGMGAQTRPGYKPPDPNDPQAIADTWRRG